MKVITAVCAVLFAATSSCGTAGLRKSLAKNRAELSVDADSFATPSGEVHMILWDKAVERLLAANVTLEQARSQQREAIREKRRRWRAFLPSPIATLSLRSGLLELSDLTSDDFTATVFAPLRIPNPITEQARTLELALRRLRAEDSYEVSRRRQIIALHRIFARWEDLQKQSSRSRLNFSLGAQELVMAAITDRQTDLAIEEQRRSLENQLSEMLNMPGARLHPIALSRPKVKYDQRIKRLQPGKNYGQLAIRLASYEIEAALLRAKGVKIRQWPAISTTASAPALYESRGGQTFDLEDVTLFGSMTKTFDLTGREAQSIKTAQENVVFVRNRLRLRLAQEGAQWQQVKRAFADLNLRERLLNKRLAKMRRADVSPGAVPRLIDELRQLQTLLDQVDDTRRRLSEQVWLWDDAQWK